MNTVYSNFFPQNFSTSELFNHFSHILVIIWYVLHCYWYLIKTCIESQTSFLVSSIALFSMAGNCLQRALSCLYSSPIMRRPGRSRVKQVLRASYLCEMMSDWRLMSFFRSFKAFSLSFFIAIISCSTSAFRLSSSFSWSEICRQNHKIINKTFCFYWFFLSLFLCHINLSISQISLLGEMLTCNNTHTHTHKRKKTHK